MKTCTKCNQEFPATLEFFHKAGKSLRGDCKGCKNKSNGKWKADNRERHNEINREWYKDNKERKAETARIWRENNRERSNILLNKASQKRRATLLKATVEDFTRQDVLEKWGTDCHICSDPIDLNNWDQDHVVPLQPEEGEPGEHTLANVKPSHPHCNRSKGNKTPCKPF